MSIGWELEGSEEKLQGFSFESAVENVNEAKKLLSEVNQKIMTITNNK